MTCLEKSPNVLNLSFCKSFIFWKTLKLSLTNHKLKLYWYTHGPLVECRPKVDSFDIGWWSKIANYMLGKCTELGVSCFQHSVYMKENTSSFSLTKEVIETPICTILAGDHSSKVALLIILQMLWYYHFHFNILKIQIPL